MHQSTNKLSNRIYNSIHGNESLFCAKENERPKNNIEEDIKKRETGLPISFHFCVINYRRLFRNMARKIRSIILSICLVIINVIIR